MNLAADSKKHPFFLVVFFVFLFFGPKVLAAECLGSPQWNAGVDSCTVTLSCSDNPPASCGINNSCCEIIYYCTDQTNSCSPVSQYSCPAGSDICTVGVIVNTNGTNYVKFYSIDKAGNQESLQTKTINLCTGCYIGTQCYANNTCNSKCQMCDKALNGTNWTSVASGYVCIAGSGKVAVSSTNFCNYGENCNEGNCSATKWWTSCDGTGNCRTAGSSPPVGSYSETVYAQTGYTLTADCSTNGTTYCATNQCRDEGSWHHICSKRCDAGHSCNSWVDASCNVDHCLNGIQDCNETGVDSGGACAALCTRQNPIVTLSPSPQSGNAGQTKTYIVNVNNKDTIQCGNSTFNLTYSCPSGWTCSLTVSSLTISPAGSGSTNLSIASPSSAAAGDYPLSVMAVNGSAPTFTGTASAIYTVLPGFNFSISIAPSAGSISQGGSISTNAAANLISGTSEPVYFSVSGLPSGASASFSPSNSCSPPCAQTMTIFTALTTPVGNYPIIVCGTNSGGTLIRCYSSYALSITAASPVVVAPSVTSNAAINITKNSVILNGTLTNMGNATSCLVWFEWGPTTSYGNTTTVQTMNSVGAFSANISGLTPNTTYYFKARAKNGGNW